MKRWNILKKLWLPYARSGISGHAAAASFYILLSLLPASALGLTVFSRLSVSQTQWTGLLRDILPARFHPIMTYLLTSVTPHHPTALLSVSAVLTLWSASKGIMALSDGLSVILQKENTRGFIRRRLDAMAVFLLLSAVLSITLIFHVFGDTVLQRLSPFYRLRHFYTLLVLSILFCFYYWLLPGRPLSFSTSLLCGSLSSVGWIVVSALYSIYVNHFQSYQRLYGSLGLLLLGCLWLHICMAVLLYSVLTVKLFREEAYDPIAIIKDVIS